MTTESGIIDPTSETDMELFLKRLEEFDKRCEECTFKNTRVKGWCYMFLQRPPECQQFREENPESRVVAIGIRRRGEKEFKIIKPPDGPKPVVINYSNIINNTPTR
jgi:hypothetical protein